MFTTFTLRYSKNEVVENKLLNVIFKSSVIYRFKLDFISTILIN